MLLPLYYEIKNVNINRQRPAYKPLQRPASASSVELHVHCYNHHYGVVVDTTPAAGQFADTE